jgi:hypothetical protein
MHTSSMAITTDTIDAATRPARPEPRKGADSSPLRDPALTGLVWALSCGAGRMPLFP